MNWKMLKTEDDYTKATIRLMEVFHAEANTAEGDELELLLVLVKDYDGRYFPIPDADVQEIIKLKMAEKGMKAKDLAPIIGSKDYVSSILSDGGK